MRPFVLIAEKARLRFNCPLPVIPQVHAVCGSSSGLVDLSCDRDCGLRVWYVGYRGSVRVASALFEHNIKSKLPSCGRCGLKSINPPCA